jgi:hypothetical protein
MLCSLAFPATAAGQLLESNRLAGAIWYPCAAEPTSVPLCSGAEDRGVYPMGVARVIEVLPGQPELHVVPSGHFAFLPPCSAEIAEHLPRFCTDPAGFDRAAFHRDFDASVLRFFRNHLVSNGGSH